MKYRLFLIAAVSWFALAATVTVAAEITVPNTLVKLIEQVEVPARESGVLAEVSVQEGAMVTPNELLARIDDTEAKLSEAQAAIELSIAQKQAADDVSVRFAKKSVEVAKAERRRADESIRKFPKSISQSEIDRVRLTVERSVLEVERAGAELEIAGFNQELKANALKIATQSVKRRTIRAPISGMVVQVHKRRGEWVEPGQTVFRILRIDRLRAEAFVSTDALAADLRGSRVELLVDLPGKPASAFQGQIVFVSPEVDPVNGQVRIWAEVENRGLLLRPGFLGKLRIKPAPK